MVQSIDVKDDGWRTLKVLYIAGIAPVIPYPICLLMVGLASPGLMHSKYPALVNIFYGIAVLYPLVPIAFLVVSFIAHQKGYPRLAYVTAQAPLVFYAFLCMLLFFIS